MRILKTLGILSLSVCMFATTSWVSAAEQEKKDVTVSIAETQLQNQSQKDLRLLSLDGGGIRGLIEIVQLANLELITGKPCHELFDVFAGTSTGGIIAGALALGLPAKDILNLYVKNGPDIFKKDFTNKWNYLGWFATQFSRSNLDGILSALTQLLDGSHVKFNSTDGSLKKRLLVTGYNTQDQEILMLDSEDKNAQDNTLANILAVTSAAPTYLDPAKIHYSGKDILGVDGGMYVNDPSHEVYKTLLTEYIAKERGQSSRQIINLQIFSLGTGNVACLKNEKDLTNKSLSNILEPMLAALFNSSAVTQENNIRKQLDYDKWVRENAKLISSEKLPGFFIDHYFRSQADLVDKATHEMSETDLETIRKLYDVGKTLTESKLLEMLDVLFPNEYSPEKVRETMEKVDADLWKMDAQRQPGERVLGRDKIYFHQLINGYVYQDNDLARKGYFGDLMYNDKNVMIKGILNVSKLSNEDVLDLNDWVMTFMKFNMLHDVDKSITYKAKNAITNFTIGKIAGFFGYAYHSGKHQELAAKLKEFYAILQKEISDRGIGGLVDSTARLKDIVDQAEENIQQAQERIIQEGDMEFVDMQPSDYQSAYQLTPEAFNLLNTREVKLMDVQLQILSHNQSLHNVNEEVTYSLENETLKELFKNFIQYCEEVESSEKVKLTTDNPEDLKNGAVRYWGEVFAKLDPSVYQNGNFQKNLTQAIEDIKSSRYSYAQLFVTKVSRYYVLGEAFKEFVSKP